MSEEKKKDIKDVEETMEHQEKNDDELNTVADTENTTEQMESVMGEGSEDSQKDFESSAGTIETPAGDAQVGTEKSSNSNKTLLIGGVIAIAVAIALYLVFGGSMMPTTEVSSNEAAAAIVNGVVVSEEDLQTQIADVESFYVSQGEPISEEVRTQMRTEALDALIGQELILQQAQDEGYAATEDDVQAVYQDEVIEYYGSDEAVIAALTTAGATKEQLLDDLAMRITISNFIDENINVESIVISDAEAQAVYDQTTVGVTDAPPFEDVIDEIKAQMQQQVITEEIIAIVESLKETADIEIK